MKSYAVQLFCGRDKVQEYFDKAVAHGRCPAGVETMELVRLYGKLICLFDDLPPAWTGSGFYEQFTSWLDAVGIPQGTEAEYYGPRMHGLEGYWPNLKIEGRAHVPA